MVGKISLLFNNKYIKPVKKLLIQGTSPKLLALGIAGAFVIGLFPVLGSTTILCAIFAFTFRLNLPLVQLINFSVYPLQLIMLVPFMKIGEILFRFEKLKYGFNDIVELVSKDTLHAIAVLWNVTIQAIGAWLIIAPVMAIILYTILFMILKRLKLNIFANKV
jgi:uncharacterized protein (DUF2062 family)